MMHALAEHVAVSLYSFNVSPVERAKAIHNHFGGDCMEIHDLVWFFTGSRAAHWATELPMLTAEVYRQHAVARYGAEAQMRVVANLGPERSDA